MDGNQPPPQIPVVIDPRLAAPRGAAYSAGALNDEGHLDDVPVHYYPEGEHAEAASTATAIDASNKGFQLLQKMGWKGKGLGKKEDGTAEPVQAGVEAGVRLGLGKQQEDDKYTDAESITRKKLEVEIQADEDPERMKRREAAAQRDHAIKQDVTQILQTFYCQVCNKQYTTAMELEEHLSSYDHHHKKRLAEARASELQRTRDERQRKEQKRQQREQQRLEEQIRKAQATAAKQQGGQQQTLPPPLPPPLPDATTAAALAAEGSAAHGGGWSSDMVAGPAAAGGWSSSTSTGGWAAPQIAQSTPAAADATPPPPPEQAQTVAPISSSGMSFGLKVAASAGRGMARDAAARGPGLAGSKRSAAAMQAAGSSRQQPPPQPVAAADSGGRISAGLGCQQAGSSSKTGTTSELGLKAAGGPATNLGGLGFVPAQNTTSGLGFTTGGSVSGGLGLKPVASTGGGLGFKAGRGGPQKAKPVSAAFGDSSDEES